MKHFVQNISDTKISLVYSSRYRTSVVTNEWQGNWDGRLHFMGKLWWLNKVSDMVQTSLGLVDFILIVAGLENWVTAAVIKFWVSSDTRKRADDVSNCTVSFMFTALGSFLRGRTSKFFTHSNTNFVILKLFGSYMCILSVRQQYLDSQRYTLDASTLNYPSVFILHRWRRRSNLEKIIEAHFVSKTEQSAENENKLPTTTATTQINKRKCLKDNKC